MTKTGLRRLDSPVSSSLSSPVTADASTLSFLHAIRIVQGTDGSRRMFVPTHFPCVLVSNRIHTKADQRFAVVIKQLYCDEKIGSMHLSVAVFAKSQDSQISVLEIESYSARSVAPSNMEGHISCLPKGYTKDVVPHLGFSGNRDITTMLKASLWTNKTLENGAS